MTVAQLIATLERYAEMAKRHGSEDSAKAVLKFSKALTPARRLQIVAMLARLAQSQSFGPKKP